MGSKALLKNAIFSILSEENQLHLFPGIDSLTETQLQKLLKDLQRFSGAFLQQQKMTLQKSLQKSDSLESYKIYDFPSAETFHKGKAYISEGKVACLVLAGGQGTRFNSPLPKALTPITVIRKKSLLQLLCEKISAASKAYQVALSVALMTTSSNYTIIQEYLEKNRFFGLSPSQLSLFNQEEAPFLDLNGQWILDPSGILTKGPDGNGYAFRYLFSSGIGERWQKQGIETVCVIPIDNPLADPFDAHLCGYHHHYRKLTTVKAIFKDSSLEKVGVLVQKKGKLGIQEYSELPSDLKPSLAHIGLFCFNLKTLSKIAFHELPWHLAQKCYQDQRVWKFEKFLFDLLDHIDNTGVLIGAKEETYAPLKNRIGNDSLETVQQALLHFDYKSLSRLTSLPIPSYLELDPAFYYQDLTPDINSFNSAYITPKDLS